MLKLLVIPSIDIRNGKTVRVVQGIPEVDSKDYGDDPVETAMMWRTENARMLHVVDFDAALDLDNRNKPLVAQICNAVVIPVEYTGGIRTVDDAKCCFDMGVSRISLSTVVLNDPTSFHQIFEKFGPKKIAVSVDVLDGEVVVRGRRDRTGLNPVTFIKQLRDMGVQRVIITDVNRNGMLFGPNIELSRSAAKIGGIKVTHSGGVRNKDELMDLQHYYDEGIDSVIIGRALYENRFPCQKLWRVAEQGIFY